MQYVDSKDLTLIGKGANGQVFKYNKPLVPSGLSAVVKVCNGSSIPHNAVRNYDLLRHAGVRNLAFYEECRVDGNPAILMEDLFNDEWVYVSPNSVRNGYGDNLPETYLLQHKLNDIKNMDSLLLQMRDLAFCTNGNGIGLDMDMVSFGVQRDYKDSDVYYKLVDIDVMLQDDSCRHKLYESNVIAAKEALTLFIKYFVETEDVKKKLMKQVEEFEW